MQRIKFDAAELAGDDAARKDQWTATLSASYVRLNADPVADRPFRGELRTALTGDVSVGTVRGTVKTIARTAADIAVHNTDNLVLLCNAGTDPIRIDQKGQSADLVTGAAVMIEQCEPSWVRAGTECHLLALQAPRRRVRLRAAGLDDHYMRPLTASSAAMALVRSYATVLLNENRTGGSAMARLAPEHLADLIAASIDDSALNSGAVGHGVAAARLRSIMRDIGEHLGSSELSIYGLAVRHGVSTRHIQKLFEAEGTTFTEYVMERRLLEARRMLSDPRLAGRTISEVAGNVGFGDLSYFTRSFRRRFEMTPSEARELARRENNTTL